MKKDIKQTIGITLVLLLSAVLAIPGLVIVVTFIGACLKMVDAFFGLIKRDTQRTKSALIKTGIYSTLFTLVLIVFGIFTDSAREKGRHLVEKLNVYHTDTGQYPATLEVLVPDYMDKVPLALPTVFFAQQFYYETSDGEFRVNYSSAPMMGEYYLSKQKQWFNYD